MPAKRPESERRQASEEELARQEEYLKKAQIYTAQLAGILGRTPTFHVQNFGCQMNARDAEKLAGILRNAGFEEIEAESADFVIYNTCTVRDNADQHFFGRLGRAAHFKKHSPYMKIAVCGCMTQEESAVEKIKKSYPYVDLIFGTHNLFCFPQYLCEVYESKNGGFDPKGHKITQIWDATDEIVEDLPVERKYSYKSGINIMFGCDNYCTYCIVPYTRGREKSRRPEDIIAEVKALAADGVKEVTLLGQNVNSYRGVSADSGNEWDFADLIYALNEVEGLERIRFMTSHPKDLSDKLIAAFAECDKLCNYIHLPVQAGSSSVLRRMNRKYTREQYLELVRKLREAVPGIAISTDIIVGFPGETEEDFCETLSLAEEIQYDSAFTFLYSPRRGTPAADYENQIPEDVKHERFNRLVEVMNRGSKARNAAFVGRVCRVLVDGPDKKSSGILNGRTEEFKLVDFEGPEELIGSMVDVEITASNTFSLQGRIVSEQE